MKLLLMLVIAGLFLFTTAYADTATGRVTIITAPPAVIINIPAAGGWYSSNFTVNASIGGTTIAATYRWENTTANGSYIPLVHQGSGIWTKNLDISSFTEGNYTIRVNASNEVNTTDEETTNFHIDNTPPVISSFTLTKTDTIYTGSTLTSADFSCSATDNSKSSGGSVTVIITGISTATAGTKTAICTANDTAGNIATASVVYTVVSAGGGGAGGGTGNVIINETGQNETTETVILEQLPAETTLKLTGFSAPIAYIELETAQAISKSDITVRIIQSSEKIPKAKAYIYFEIDSNIPEDAIKSIRIAFSVDKDWLTENDLSADDVTLYRLVGETWKELDTTRVDESGNRYAYVAKTPGFSTFAIAAKAPVLLNAVTGSAISIPTIPLSADTFVLGLIVLVLIAAIVIARMKSPKKRRY
jgi:PGF-pre-PGF domain-containing protein